MTAVCRVFLLVVVALLAAFFRLHQLDRIPPGLFIDEAQDGLDARAIQRGQRLPVMIDIGEGVKGRSREPMFHYLMAGVFAAFGPTVRSIRLTSAVIGSATVVVFFLVCERFVGLRTAFLAGALLAVCRWHVTFSRIGLRAILVPLWIGLTLLALHALARRRTGWAAIVFGITFGLGFYTYYAYWTVPVALAPLLVLGIWRTRAAHARLAGLGVGAFLVVTAPLIGYAVTKPAYYFTRVLEVTEPLRLAEDRSAVLRDNLQKVLFMMHLRGDWVETYNIAYRPLLDPIMGVAFLVGLFVVLKTIRDDTPVKLGMLLFWLVPLFPAVVSTEVPSGMRALGAVLATCLIAAVGLNVVTELGAQGGQRWRWTAGAVPALALMSCGALNYRAYFIEWGRSEAVARAYTVDVVRFFAYCADLADRHDVYMSPYVYHSPNVRFLNLDRQAPLRLIDGDTAFTAAGADDRDRVFVCEAPGINAVIEKLYPEHETLGNYAVYGAHSGRIVRIAKQRLLASLTAEQRQESAYWVNKMLTDFRERTRKW